jgi:Ca2+-binding RTX toxin-like protein
MNVRTIHRLCVSAAAATLVATALTGIAIADEDGSGEPTIVVHDVSVPEGGEAHLVIELVNGDGSAGGSFETQTASASIHDFTQVSSGFSLSPEDPTWEYDIPTTADDIPENDEYFVIDVFSVNGATLQGDGKITIIDDDGDPLCPGYEEDPRNQVVGSVVGDELVGTPGVDVICGLGGDDTITGKGGSDLIIAGGGDDTVRGGLGNDSIFGGEGRDALIGDAGNDLIDLGPGSDSGDGADFGYFGAGGGSGNDTLIGGSGADDLFGWTGADDLKGGPGEDVLYGDEGSDSLAGAGAFDFLVGFSGNDVLNGGPAFDCADWEFDTGPVVASLTSNTASGPGIGSDDLVQVECLLGTAKADRLTGNNLRNTLWGLNGADDLFGLGGNDYLHGWAGYDHLDCGAGSDDLGLAGAGGASRLGCEHTTLSATSVGRSDTPMTVAGVPGRTSAMARGPVAGR